MKTVTLSSKVLKLAFAAIVFTAVGCSSDDADKAEAGVAKTEDRDSLMNIQAGNGDSCPTINGKYSCVEENTTDAYEVVFEQGYNSDGQPVFKQSGAPSGSNSVIGTIFEQYIMNIEGGIVSDGSIQDKSISALGSTVPLKYAVSCAGDVFSLQLVSGNNGSRTTLVKQDDGKLQIESWQTADGGRVVSGRSNCQLVQ